MGFRLVELGDVITSIATGPFGSNLKVSCFTPSGFPVVDGANLKGYKLTDNITKYVSEEKAASLSRSIAHRGDVVATISGNVGQVSYIPNDSAYPAYLCSQRQFKVTFDTSRVYVPYLVYYLHTREGQHQILSFVNQTGVPALAQPTRNFKRIVAPLPPLEEQIAIARIPELLDRSIELNNQVNGYLEELLDAEFAEMQAEADDTWKDASLLDIANYKNGLAMQKFRPQPGDKGLPVLKIRELGQGECGPDAERCSSDIEDSVHVRDGDLIFSWSGTLMLDFWAGGDAGLNQHLFKMTSDKYPSWFYYMWTKHHMRKFIAMAKDRATTMGHIKRSALANAAVKIPPSDVLRSQTKAMQPLVDEVVGLKIQSRKLANLRDALLPKLMSGEIDVSKVEVPTPPNSHLSGR
jgi:type I restriction enzyme S subunit